VTEPKRELSEEEMLYLEAMIPELAAAAFKLAEAEALTISGKVVKVVNGKVIELYADGSTRVLKEIEPPMRVVPGTKRYRRG
jgi:hypothetical protein